MVTPQDLHLMASYSTTYSAYYVTQCTYAGNAVNTGKFRTLHPRFRFCLDCLSGSVFCIFPNQILVENYRRSSDVFLVSSMFTVAFNDFCFKAETCKCIELHGCCTVSEASVLERLGSFDLFGAIQQKCKVFSKIFHF